MTAPVDPQPGPDFKKAREGLGRLCRATSFGEFDKIVTDETELLDAVLDAAESALLRAAEEIDMLKRQLSLMDRALTRATDELEGFVAAARAGASPPTTDAARLAAPQDHQEGKP